MSAIDVLVAGGGPAGMNAALAAAECGLAVTLLDEGIALGGQIYRPATSAARAAKAHPEGERLRAAVVARSDRITVRTETGVWAIFDGLCVAIDSAKSSTVLRPGALVLATGAYEYVPPFPGWTLPGVMTPGAAQILAKTMGVAAGERVVLAGTGPFLLAVASSLIDAGLTVRAVLEASPRAPWLALPLHGWRTPSLLREGMRYWRKLSRAGVALSFGRIVTSADGDDAVRSVTHAPCDADWRPDRAQQETIDADALLVGYGFVPRVQLAQMAGCRLEFRAEIGGWVPVRDADLATTAEGVFAAGDGAGVAGSIVAAHEGRLAGLAAARRLGALTDAAFAATRRPIDAELARLLPFRRALDRICAIRPGLAELVTDDTIVCRCEEVTAAEARTAIASGCSRYRTLKVVTRIGMGPCQGRFCWPSVARMVARETNTTIEELGPASARPPVRPVTIGALAAMPKDVE